MIEMFVRDGRRLGVFVPPLAASAGISKKNTMYKII
jgi:hypothetical protein